MASNDYQFISRWRVEGDIQKVYDILRDGADLPRWWPAVYLEAYDVETPEASAGTGDTIAVQLHTRGWLPYHLHWQSQVVAEDPPRTFTIRATGDFDGRGIWTLEQDGPYVNVTFDWQLRADKPLLRYLSFLMKPMFSANHRWAMARGEESLQLELSRQAAADSDARAAIPDPPGPSSASALTFGLAAVLVAVTGIGLLRRRR